MMLHLGDCLDVMQGIPDGSVDLTVTSPPYDNLRTYNGNNDQWGEHVWKAVIADLYRVTADGGVVVWVVADATIKGSETGTSFKQALWAMECGFRLHDTMIYKVKGTGAKGSNYAYWQEFEYMFIFSKYRPKSINFRTIRRVKSAGGSRLSASGEAKRENRKDVGEIIDSKIGNVWEYSVGTDRTVRHPAKFPLKLATDHILSWSNPGNTLLDPFLGSGTTGVAAANTRRKFIGIERDPDYFQIAQARIQKAQADAITNRMREATRL